MWMDAEGVTHTVALPDPPTAMSPETLASLDAMSAEERTRVLEAVDDYYWNDYVAASRSDIIPSTLAPEGAQLPDGFLTGGWQTPQTCLRW